MIQRFYLLLVVVLVLSWQWVFAQVGMEVDACQQAEEQLYFNTTLNKQQSSKAYLDSLKRCGQDDIEALMGVAKYLYKINDLDESERIFRQIRMEPRAGLDIYLPEVSYYQGLISIETSAYEDGIAYFKESMDAGYNRALVCIGIGRILLDVGQKEKAKDLFLTAVEIEPGLADSYYQLGVYFDSKKLPKQSLDYLLRADSLSNGTMLKNQLLLINTLRTMRRYEEAYSKADALVAVFPTSKEALYILGYTAANLGKHEIAYLIIDQYKKQGLRTSDDYFEVGFIFDCAAAEDSAAVYYSVCLKLDPTFKAAWRNLGVSYRENGEFENAHACFDRVLEMDSMDYHALIMKVQNYIWQHDYAQSLWWANKVNVLFPDHHGSYLDRGYILLLMKRYYEAIPLLKQQLEYNEQDNRAWNNLGACYTGLGVFDEAEIHFEKALAFNPDNSYAYHNRALLYQKQGRYDLACEDLKESIDREYTWLIDTALISMQQVHCPEVNINRKVKIFGFKGNTEYKQHLSFIEVTDLLAQKAFESIPHQAAIEKEIPEVNELIRSNVVVFPNPSKGYVTIRHSFSSASNYLKVFSENGTVVFSSSMAGPSETFDFGHLAAGLYVILFYGEGNIVSSQKLVLL